MRTTAIYIGLPSNTQRLSTSMDPRGQPTSPTSGREHAHETTSPFSYDALQVPWPADSTSYLDEAEWSQRDPSAGQPSTSDWPVSYPGRVEDHNTVGSVSGGKYHSSDASFDPRHDLPNFDTQKFDAWWEGLVDYSGLAGGHATTTDAAEEAQTVGLHFPLIEPANHSAPVASPQEAATATPVTLNGGQEIAESIAASNHARRTDQLARLQAGGANTSNAHSDLSDPGGEYDMHFGNGGAEVPSRPVLEAEKGRRPAGKQCEHDPGCSRAARRIRGQFDGKRLCGRHATQWAVNNSEAASWTPETVPVNQALAMIRPDVVPPFVYRRNRAHDRSLHEHRDAFEEWTVRFHRAAMTPYVGEGEAGEDPYKLVNHQKVFNRKAMRRGNHEYMEEMICARISLLFPIALRYHEGGPAIYSIGGDNSGYHEDTRIKFADRLALIESILRVNKRVVMDVIEGRGVEAFVRGPQEYDKRKRTNKRGNVARQEHSAGAERSTAGPSRRSSMEDKSFYRHSRSEDDEAATTIYVVPEVGANERKGKRLIKAKSEEHLSARALMTQTSGNKRRKALISGQPPRHETIPDSHLCGQHFGEVGLDFGPTIQDTRLGLQTLDMQSVQQDWAASRLPGAVSPNANVPHPRFSVNQQYAVPPHPPDDRPTEESASAAVTEYQLTLVNMRTAAERVSETCRSIDSSPRPDNHLMHALTSVRSPPVPIQTSMSPCAERRTGQSQAHGVYAGGQWRQW